MLNELVRDLAVTWDGGQSLLDRVAELMVPGTNRQRGSAGKRAHSPAPLAVHVLDLLMLIERESLAWERSFRRVLDLDDLDRRGKDAGLGALLSLPGYAHALGVQLFVEGVERDVAFWHARALSLMGVSPLEQRYKITEQAAEAVGKTPGAFRTWASRNKLEAVGTVPIGAHHRYSVWDMREVLAVSRRGHVTSAANGRTVSSAT